MCDNKKYLPQRKSPRANWSEYAGGLYFITIVTHHRRHYFGEINNGCMHLNPIGKIAQSSIIYIGQIYDYCKVLNYVVMPNHIHIIIYIDEKLLPCEKRTKEVVNNEKFHSGKGILCNSWLSHVIGHLKSYISKFAHSGGAEFSWQNRFHDHIIRNMDEYITISNYVNDNVIKWESDCFNKTMD